MACEPLDNVALGAAGERHFDAICIPAKLISHAPDMDLMGWDRIVEWQAGAPPLLSSFDQRPPLLSCYVQIKSTYHANAIRLSLSNAGRLVNEPKPAFVYALRYNAENAPETAYLFHIFDEAFDRILARLRAEFELHGNDAPLNHKTIDFNFSDAQELAPTGEAFRLAVEKATGGAYALHTYVARKLKALQEAGYGPDAHTGKVTINANSHDELIEGFLGLRPLSVSSFKYFETRYGIALPVVDMHKVGDGQMTITPSNPKACQLIVDSPQSGPPIVVDGEIRAPGLPDLALDETWFLFRHSLFDLIFKHQDKRSFTIKDTTAEWKNAHHPQLWRDYHRLMHRVANPPFSIRLLIEEGELIEYTIAEPPPALKGEQHRYAAEVADRLCEVLQQIGPNDIVIPWQELETSQPDVHQCLGFIRGTCPSGGVSFEPLPGAPTLPGSIDFHFIHVFPLGEKFVAYAVSSTGHVKRIDATTKIDIAFGPLREIRVLTTLDHVRSFEQRVEAKTKCGCMITSYSKRLAQPPTFIIDPPAD
jgi:hypothetical protein